jgi:membrane protein required for colicin V production
MTAADIFDLCMLLIVLFFSVKGVLHGFSSEIFSLIGIIAGIYLGLAYSAPVDAFIRGYFPQLSPALSRIIAIAIVFFAVCIICALIGKLLKAILNFVYLSTLDRMCGLLIGFIKGAAIVVFLVILLNRAKSFLPNVELGQSRTVAIVNALLPNIENYIDSLLPPRVS